MNQTSKGFDWKISLLNRQLMRQLNYVLKGDGTFILANVEKTTGNVTVGELLPDVSSLENLIFTADNSKFTYRVHS